MSLRQEVQTHGRIDKFHDEDGGVRDGRRIRDRLYEEEKRKLHIHDEKPFSTPILTAFVITGT